MVLNTMQPTKTHKWQCLPVKVLSLLFVAVVSLAAQEAPPGPTITILTPKSMEVAPSLADSVQKLEKSAAEDYVRMEQYLRRMVTERDSVPKHLRADFDVQVALLLDQLEFQYTMMTVNRLFAGQVSATMKVLLQHFLSEPFPNVDVSVVPDSSIGRQDALREAGRRHPAQYLINFPRISLEMRDGEIISEVEAQLYDVLNDTLYISQKYNGDAINRGGPFECGQGSIHCAIVNGMIGFVQKAVQVIYLTNPHVQTEQLLFANRSVALLRTYLGNYCDEEMLQLVPRNPTIPPQSAIYACIPNEDRTQIVVYYAEQVPEIPQTGAHNSYGDSSFRLVENISGSPHDTVNVYACILIGALDEGRWYFEKRVMSYLRARSLNQAQRSYFIEIQDYNFFKPNSTEFDPRFWHTGFFERIEDVTQHSGYDPNDPYYKEFMNTYGAFIGKFKFVADQLRR